MSLGMTEGQRFKLAFLLGLFITNLTRCVIILYDGFASFNGKSDLESRASTLGFALMDLPTLGLMTSFSLLIYYIAQLTLLLEMEQLGLFEDDQTKAQQRRQMLLQNGGHGMSQNEHFMSSQNFRNGVLSNSLSERYQQPNVLKPLFLSCNSLAYLAYIITILAFVMSKKAIEIGDEEGGSEP